MTETSQVSPDLKKAKDVVNAWVAELIGEKNITAEDNFLDLGGHSMLALELNAKARERFGAEFDMEILFERSLGDATADVVRRTTETKLGGQ